MRAVYHRLRETVRAFEESPFVRFFAIVALLIVPVQYWQGVQVNRATLAEIRAAAAFRGVEAQVAAETLAALRAESAIRKEEALVREEQARARAWALLTSRAPGNSGKTQALEYLAATERSLAGLDLSCRAMGGLEGERCARPTYLAFVDLSVDRVGHPVELHRANLSGVNLQRSHFRRAELQGAQLIDADLSYADFAEANLDRAQLDLASLYMTDLSRTGSYEADFAGADGYRADFRSARLSGADFSDAALVMADFGGADLNRADFSGAHLSHAIFTGALNVETASFDGAWAWHDQPPRGLDADLRRRLAACRYTEAHGYRTRAPETCAPARFAEQ